MKKHVYKTLLSRLLCILLFGAFALSNYGNSAPVASDPIQMNSTAKSGIPPALQLELTGSGQMLLSWTELPGATVYELYQATVPDPLDSEAWTLLATLPSETLSYAVDSDQPKGFFYVRALDLGSLTLVEGGSFHNGASTVTVSSFYLDRYELTQGEYQAVMGSNPAAGFGIGSDYPVYYVSWFKAIEYCNRRSILEGLTPCYSYRNYGTNPDNWGANWPPSSNNHRYVSCDWTANGYRLPTEMEWMYAARAGNQTHNYTYSGSNDLDSVAWYSANAANLTHTVGGKLANELGLYDMSGNVFEWVWDIYGDYPDAAQNNPRGPTSGSYRLSRGGAWNSNAEACTVSIRTHREATFSSFIMGFRVCRAIP